MDERPPTEMIHYECCECSMDATGVVTEALGVEWLRHMESHGPMALYNSWAWKVVPMRFSPVEPPPVVVPERHLESIQRVRKPT